MTIRLAALAFAALGLTAAAPPPDPLKQLCDRICGGTWESTDIPAPDQFVTTYSYEWDERLGVVHGRIVTIGGVGGIHTEADVFFGRDSRSGTLWTVTVRSDGPGLHGSFSLGGDGYMTTVEPFDDSKSRMISRYVFSGSDGYTRTDEILAPGQAIMGQPQTWRRRKA